MHATTEYLGAANDYADAIRTFFEGAPAGLGERAGARQVSISVLTDRAEILAPKSARLIEAADAQLAAEDPELYIEATFGLLASALLDLDVSNTLKSAADEEADGAEPERGAQAERSAVIMRPTHLDDTLSLLLGEVVDSSELAIRSRRDFATTIAAARTELKKNAQDTLMLIRDRAAKTGWKALGGVAVEGLPEAVNLVSMDVASAFGQADKLAHIYELARTFLGQAYASLQTLLGPALTKILSDKVVEWIKEAGSGRKFNELVERFYGTEQTGEVLVKIIDDSQADLAQYTPAMQGIDTLEANYRKQTEIADKILKACKWVAIIPAVMVPQGHLIMAAVYILVGGYIVIAGADYTDAQNLQIVDRVPGVLRVVETNLS